MANALTVGLSFSLSVVLKPLLRLQGFQVRSAASGSEALAQIQAEIPDIVITEDILSDMRSDHLEQKIRRDLFLQNPRAMDIKLMILVAPTPSTMGMTGYGFGPRQAMVKPVDPGILASYSTKLVTFCPPFAPLASDQEQRVARQYLILVVDADPVVRTYIQIVLERQGYRVETALNTKEGLEMMQRNRPNMVIASGHSGTWNQSENEMFYWIKGDPELQNIPFILLEEGRLESGLHSDPGPDYCTGRPPEASSLRSSVKRLLASPTRRQMWPKNRAS
jgi:CheY-like chemotaxis protein